MERLLLLAVVAGALALSSCAVPEATTEPFAITDEFVAYIKSRTNPFEWGLRDDGRFYPYSPPGGRLIGYRQEIADETYYSQGWPKEEAEKQLRADLNATLVQLRQHLRREYPAHPFDSLSRKSQEILLDFAHSEGVTNLKPEFYETVIGEDWQRLFGEDMYLRWVEKGWTDKIVNKAFANRWLDPEARESPWEK